MYGEAWARHQLGLLCILVSSIACGEEQASGTFDSLTYNVAGLPQGISGSDPENNIPQISPLLKQATISCCFKKISLITASFSRE